MAINEYKYRRDDRDTMIDYCPDCGEIFEIVDTI
jgi:rRNA maturation protein Nop10